MKDRKINMVILGLLSRDSLTGYEIKKQVDAEIFFFWKGSFGSIYPSLASMEASGYVRKLPADDRDAKRERIRYVITDNGRRQLQEWLLESRTANDLKYEMLLKVFFGSVTDNKVTIATIEEFEKEIARNLAVFKIYKGYLAKELDQRENKFYYLTITFGIETYEGYLRWCKEAKELLK